MSEVRPDRIDTEQYGELRRTAEELLMADKPSKSTTEFYQKRFRYWLAWCDGRDDVDPWEPPSKSVINTYIRSLKSDDSSKRKIEHRVRAVRGTYDILAEEGFVDSNPISDYYASDYLDGKPSNVRSVAENREGPRANYDTITPEEYQQLLDNVPAPKLRNQLIVKLLWSLMIRSEEITTIRIDDVIDDENKIWIKDAKKDETDDDLWFEAFYKDDCQYLLDRWRDTGRENLAPEISQKSEYLFLTHQKEQMRPEHVSRMVKDAARNAGIQEEMYVDGKGDSRWKVTAHTLRRSAATFVANKTDYPIHMLSADLNHRSVDTTIERYVRGDSDERRQRRQDIDEL